MSSRGSVRPDSARLICMVISVVSFLAISIPVHGQGSADEIEAETLARIHRFISIYADPLSTAQMVIESEYLAPQTEMDAEQTVANAQRGGIIIHPDRAELRRRIVERSNVVRSRRLVFWADFDRDFSRIEWTTEGIRVNLTDPDQPSSRTHRMNIAGSQGHWNIDHDNHNAELRHRAVPPGELFPFGGWDNWGPYEIFLRGEDSVEILHSARGVQASQTSGEHTWAHLLLSGATPSTEVWVAYETSSDMEDAPLSGVFRFWPGSQIAAMEEICGWRRDGALRPTIVRRQRWQDVDRAVGPRELALGMRPDHDETLRALLLQMNCPVDGDLFTFDPPENYLFAEDTGNETWVIRHAPTETAPSSMRQQRIAESLAVAQSTHRWSLGLALAGGAMLLLGGLIILRRAHG